MKTIPLALKVCCKLHNICVDRFGINATVEVVKENHTPQHESQAHDPSELSTTVLWTDEGPCPSRHPIGSGRQLYFAFTLTLYLRTLGLPTLRFRGQNYDEGQSKANYLTSYEELIQSLSTICAYLSV